MAKSKDPLLEALKQNRSYTWTIPEGGDLASMRKAVKHGQTLTMSPVNDPHEIQTGDMVLVRWHGGTVFHLVGEIEGDQFLIVNSVGKENGWVGGSEILGRITKIVEPEERPSFPDMLKRLEGIYRSLISQRNLGLDDAGRLLSVISDLHWFAERLGEKRLDVMPRSNKWSFMQNLWRLTRQAESATSSGKTPPTS
jgi:hypothetical protein